jgi:hypothetical protein
MWWSCGVGVGHDSTKTRGRIEHNIVSFKFIAYIHLQCVINAKGHDPVDVCASTPCL